MSPSDPGSPHRTPISLLTFTSASAHFTSSFTRPGILGLRLWAEGRAWRLRQGVLLHRLDQPDHQREQLLVTVTGLALMGLHT